MAGAMVNIKRRDGANLLDLDQDADDLQNLAASLELHCPEIYLWGIFS